MNRWIVPLIVTLLCLAFVLSVLPPLLTRNALRLRIIALHDAVAAEDMAAIEQLVLPAQRGLARSAIEPVLAGHGHNVGRMRIRSMEKLAADRYLVHGLVHVDDPSWGETVLEGRVLWIRAAGQWYWSIDDSAGRPFTLGDQQDWTKAVDWLNLAAP